jgi:sugar phosphate isomerase/epimerase
MSYRFGIIPGILRDEIRADQWGTLARLAQLGFQGVEGDCVRGADLAASRENRRRLDDLGLAAIALTCSLHREAELASTIEHAEALGAPFVVTYWGPAESEEQLRRDAGVYQRMAVQCAAAGVQYCYHHHDQEFTHRYGEKGRRYALEILLEHAPQLAVELDLAWCRVGGVDPVRLLAQLAGRVPIVHLKDATDVNLGGRFCTLGNGVVDVWNGLRAAVAHGARWVVYEQDRPARLSPWDSVTASILNLREQGLLPGPT